MRYPASEKLEIIRIVEQSHLPAKQTLDRLGIARPTFYRWYDLYLRFGEDALADRRPGPKRGWNRIPDKVRGDILDMALERTDLSPRELAVTFTDEQRYFVSEASVYRLLKAPDPEKPHPAGELLSTRRSRSPDRGVRRTLQPSALSREP